MKVLVTGGAGFIGSHIVDAYINAGHDVLTIDNLSHGRREVVNAKAALHMLDITSPEVMDLIAAERPDLVNHHAAHMDIRESVADPAHDARTNVLGTINLLEASRRAGVQHFTFASTGGAIYGVPTVLPVAETHPTSPLSPYGASKLASEVYIRMYRELYGLRYTILRYANVYGPRQDPGGEAGVIAIFAGRMLEGKPVQVFGSGEQVRDYVFVGDVTAANMACGPHTDRGCFNIGTGVGTSVNQLVKKMSQQVEWHADVEYLPARRGELDAICLDASAARAALNWKPATDIDTGLALTLEFFRSDN